MRSMTLRRTTTIIAIAVIIVFASADADATDRWQWSLTPYMWATDISEKLLLDGNEVGGDDTEFDIDLSVDKTTFLVGLYKDFGRRWNATLLAGFGARDQLTMTLGYRF